ncbi:Lysine-specific permease [Klebsiella variicola]|uniref:Lysine-specific permease n=1 Tax=Klebsiella variicola TaxID=244366 RepID=A0A7H4ME73_KLEVA|nr:Lysine-specific permease [Klebsiella variicola]
MQSTTQQQGGQLKRTMKTRHLIMLSLGGVIGTGLFFNTGYIISTTGAAGTLAGVSDWRPGGLAGDAVPR